MPGRAGGCNGSCKETGMDGREPLAAFDRLIAPTLGIVAAVDLFCLMALTCVDVVGRYFFNSPVHGGFELTEMLLAGLIFTALPLVTVRGDHVTVDLLEPVTPLPLLRLQHIAACAASCVATAYLAYRLWVRALVMDNAGETTAQLKLKLAYLTYGMAVLMALTAVAFLVLALRRPGRQRTGEI
jgi:TRAP-type C4-dicarboxylate transport system permease small subunit